MLVVLQARLLCFCNQLPINVVTHGVDPLFRNQVHVNDDIGATAEARTNLILAEAHL